MRARRRNAISTYELKIMKILHKENMAFERGERLTNFWGGLYRMDFTIYLNGEKIFIEVDGEQHFKPVYGKDALVKQKEHDRRKNSFCLSHGIKLYRIPHWELRNVNSLSDILQDKFLVRSKWHNDAIVPY